MDDGQLTFYGKDPYIANADRLNVESELYFIPSVLPGEWWFLMVVMMVMKMVMVGKMMVENVGSGDGASVAAVVRALLAFHL